MISPVLPLYERADINFTHGKGVYIYAEDGKEYLDFAAGYAANSLGHCHPKMVKALKQQIDKVWHLSNRYQIPGLQAYSKRLAEISFADTMFIANSGAEAVECMMKMARKYHKANGNPKRYRIITLDGAFHGRTLACASAGSAEKIRGFEPAVDGFDRVPWHDLEAMKKAITKETAGIMLEPIQGEGGMRAHDLDFLKKVRKLCDDKGILLLLDEVQCGMARTGHMFAYELYGITPDLLALGKGLGSGFPVSACLATEEVGKAMEPDTHGTTFGGNPLAVAVGTSVLEIMTDKKFLPHVNHISKYLREKLAKLAKKYPDYIEGITGYGLMCGVKFKKDVNLDQYCDYIREEGLLSVPASNQIMRLTPPLIIEEKHVDEAIKKLDAATKRLSSTSSNIGYKVKRAVKTVKKAVGGE